MYTVNVYVLGYLYLHGKHILGSSVIEILHVLPV